MNIISIIEHKRDHKELKKEEIEFFIQEYTKGTIADYQAASLIMAIFLNGMTKQETTDLTLAMANSGETLNLDFLGKTIVDKHSTGGVGDKVSLILLPLVASLGVPVAKMSGRGLGFTGGTVDKLESIPGYQTGISIHSFLQNVENIGISMISQTMNLAPADKKLYALRDSIACVENISLIASSIMSKKIASGAQKIVLDVTVGKGAFMKNQKQAEELANEMIEIGKLAKRETVCVLTNMEEPLGKAVGNQVEVKEAVAFLKGSMPQDLKEVVFSLGSYMLELAGIGQDEKHREQMLLQAIQEGKAYEKFLQLVQTQGGDISYLEDLDKFPKAFYQEEVVANKQGWISEIDAQKVGRIASNLGAGRIKKEDKIDPTVGIIFEKKVAQKVEKGEILAYLYANDKEKLALAKKELEDTIQVADTPIEPLPTIFKVIR